MLRFVTSLSFLYGFTIAALLIYGFFFYRRFRKTGSQKKTFPYVFLLISAACISFLYLNINARLKQRTFSNLDHHFIRHDGFQVAGTIELGRTDTASNPASSFNRFLFDDQKNNITVASVYSEEPFYIAEGQTYRLASASWPAMGHSINFRADSINASLKTTGDSSFTLLLDNEAPLQTGKIIHKASTAWNLFKENEEFINSTFYTDEKLINALKNIVILRQDVSGNENGELRYFIAGRMFQWSHTVKYDGMDLGLSNLAFKTNIPDKSTIAWGIGFPDNNKNQFRVKNIGGDSFALLNRYPVSYPMSEENREDWQPHNVSKFLLSDSKDMLNIPGVFSEGFLFPAFRGDNTVNFAPVLLSYHKQGGNAPLELQARFINGKKESIRVANDKLVLPARLSQFSWIFSINNTFNWDFGKRTLSPSTWQMLMFGSLLFFFVLIFFSSLLKPADKLSWIWQLLSCLSLVLLTTRYFMYWRYKSFPPYEGIDLPTQQQLLSIWNFGIIVFASLALAVIFGFGLLKKIYSMIGKRAATLLNKSFRAANEEDSIDQEMISSAVEKLPGVRRFGTRLTFFGSWLLFLLAGGAFAAMRHFDPATCRHLAIGLMLLYFIYVFISYKHSPLSASSEKSWWQMSTNRNLDLMVSNPVKVLLSISLLAVFVFVDIGFAIVFLNFLLFNEAFLCINYAMAGLSAGSRRNAMLFGMMGFGWLLLFILNLLYAPFVLRRMLDLPRFYYVAGYALFGILIAYVLTRLLIQYSARKKMLIGLAAASLLFAAASTFFPKEKILEKAEITRYRIDVMTMPAEKAIESAYADGKTYEPVIRAAQNQWFINTFIYDRNNPAVQSTGFNLLPHAPQNKGAKYNAQASDLVASRFFIAEHGVWSVLLFVLLMMIPATLLASFYKLYPDFTNRINTNYATITAGFSILNYLLIMSLLVILAATGRYIFFGQDLPFGSIISKQSVLFPSLLIVGVIILFKKIPLEYYPNRKKLIPGAIVFGGLASILFIAKPIYNKNKEFNVANLAQEMDSYIQLRLQPVMDYFDSAKQTRKLTMRRKDQLFTDSIRKMSTGGMVDDAGKFFSEQIKLYTRAGFTSHLDQSRMLYLDLYSGRPQLAVNDNYFRIEPPPHLQQSWTGNVFGDTSIYNISLWDAKDGSIVEKRLTGFTTEPNSNLVDDLALSFRSGSSNNGFEKLWLVNKGEAALDLKVNDKAKKLGSGDSINLMNPCRIVIGGCENSCERILRVQPDAFMKNYYVNGNRYYLYPEGSDFIWARNFAESISSEYNSPSQRTKNAFVSFDHELMDSLSAKIRQVIGRDTAYKKGAEYGICIADGNGRMVAMSDYIKGMNRPDPNDKAAFAKAIQGENGYISQSLLRKQIGNINLLRLNPGPGSTLKPIVFAAVASQLNLDWDQLSSQGFTDQQHYFGGEKVAGYDFEKNNGLISKLTDYIRYSDNYYHSNVLLLGSYRKQDPEQILSKYFATNTPNTHPGEDGVHWPWFVYKNRTYWLDGYENWPGYFKGKVELGDDSSFVSIGLNKNFGIYTRASSRSFDRFNSTYDSLLFGEAYRKSGFLLPEYGFFDQQGEHVDHRIPYDVFPTCFRGHVKGSSQVLVPPVKMLDIFGKLISQSKNYSVTLNPYAAGTSFMPFDVDSSIVYNNYLSIMRENLFLGMRQALFSGTAARLGTILKDGSPYYYFAKTGTTGDNDAKTKSKLFTLIISSKDISNPDFNFRNNKFYTIYFTSQNGPAKQNEEFQAAVIKLVEEMPGFLKYMRSK